MAIWFERTFNHKNDLPSFVKESIDRSFATIGTINAPYDLGRLFTIKTDTLHLLIAIDGEISNLHDLAAKFDMDSDISQIISKLYISEGHQGLYHLDGVASIILYDINQNTTLLYRCFMRGLPLYFVNKNERLTVCTNPVYLLHRDDVEDTINEAEIANLFALRVSNVRETPFTQIEALAHGELVIIDSARSVKRMKKPLKTVFKKASVSSDEQSIFETYRKLLDSAVSEVILPDKKYGIMLSSGMDSSSIAYYVAKQLHEQGREVTAYSWELPGDKADEAQNIRRIADKLNIPLKLFDAEIYAPFDHLDDIFLTPDTPLVNGYWKLMQENHRRASEDGIDIMIAGTYGDMLFRDDRHNLLKEIWRDKRFDIIEEIIKQRGMRGVLGEIKRFFKHSKRSAVDSKPWLTTKSKNLIEQDADFSLGEGFEHFIPGLCPFSVGYLGTDRYLTGPLNLQRIEPHQNRALLNFSLNMPTYMTFRHNLKKYFVRESMKGLLPDEIVTQPRVGIITGMVERSFDRNREKVKEKIWENSSSWNSYVSEKWMREKLQNDSQVDSNDLYVIWTCITLSTWLKAIKPGGSLYED